MRKLRWKFIGIKENKDFKKKGFFPSRSYLHHVTEMTFRSLTLFPIRMQAGVACTKPALYICQAVFVYISAYPSKAFLTFHPELYFPEWQPGKN